MGGITASEVMEGIEVAGEAVKGVEAVVDLVKEKKAEDADETAAQPTTRVDDTTFQPEVAAQQDLSDHAEEGKSSNADGLQEAAAGETAAQDEASRIG
jgi:thioesterase domain-containing protein